MRIPTFSRRAIIGAVAGATLLVATGASALAVSRVGDDNPSASDTTVVSSTRPTTAAPTSTTVDDHKRGRGEDDPGRGLDDDPGEHNRRERADDRGDDDGDHRGGHDDGDDHGGGSGNSGHDDD